MICFKVLFRERFYYKKILACGKIFVLKTEYRYWKTQKISFIYGLLFQC